VFGCDVCQDVCPWNSPAPLTQLIGFEPRADSNPVDLIGLLEMDEASFRERFRHTALWRSRRRGLLRNAAIALGNRPTLAAIPALIRGLNDDEPLVRGACAWALGQYDQTSTIDALMLRRLIERGDVVLREISVSLGDAIDSLEQSRPESTT
jgi:epoxyqueuosine reductase